MIIGDRPTALGHTPARKRSLAIALRHHHPRPWRIDPPDRPLQWENSDDPSELLSSLFFKSHRMISTQGPTYEKDVTIKPIVQYHNTHSDITIGRLNVLCIGALPLTRIVSELDHTVLPSETRSTAAIGSFFFSRGGEVIYLFPFGRSGKLG